MSRLNSFPDPTLASTMVRNLGMEVSIHGNIRMKKSETQTFWREEQVTSFFCQLCFLVP